MVCPTSCLRENLGRAWYLVCSAQVKYFHTLPAGHFAERPKAFPFNRLGRTQSRRTTRLPDLGRHFHAIFTQGEPEASSGKLVAKALIYSALPDLNFLYALLTRSLVPCFFMRGLRSAPISRLLLGKTNLVPR